MSPRPFRLRKVNSPPLISGFKPYGKKKDEDLSGSVFLHLEEYEAIRLCDFEMLNHQQAAILMNVSRPTVTRVYSKARKKIAEALVLGKQIIIEGGKIYFDSEWFSCDSCGCYFNNPEKLENPTECPLCKSTNFHSYQADIYREEIKSYESADVCFCPSCGFEKRHHSGYRCKDENCPDCGKRMIRKNAPFLNNI